jgi:CHAT domain-containing protein
VGDRSVEAKTLNNVGAVYRTLGENQKALEYYNQALPLHRAVGDRGGEATTLTNIGAVYRTLGEKQKALEYFAKALPVFRAVGDRVGEARALTNIGAFYRTLGENQKALEYYSQALPLHRAVGDREGEAATLALLMAYWNKEGNGPLAAFFGKQAINAIQYIRQNIQGMEKSTQSAFLKSREDVYRYLADVLVAQGRLFEAQQVLGLLKEEEFKEFTRDLGSGGAAGALAMTSAERAIGERYDQAAGAVAAAWAEWNALNEKKGRTPEEDARLLKLNKQLEDAETSFQAFVSQELYQQLGKNKNADSDVRELEQKTSDLQAVLREVEPGTVALYTVAAPERLIVILVLPDVRIAREYPIKPEALRDKVFKFWRALSTNSPDALPAAQELYKIVLGPVEKDLEAAHAKTLMWSLDDVLRYIPIAALHDGRQYVVEKYRNEVFTLSSISKLKDEPRVKAWQILAMGVSKSYGGSQPLPSVPGELHGIVRAKAGSPGGLLEGVELLDDDFTEEAFTQALAQRFPLVHIASHFLFQAGVDDLSYLLLGGKTDAGEHLTLAHIKTAPNIRFLNTELLTLSACDTAMSGERNGREIDGLGEVAQRKGAKAVVASLWSVSDRSTGALMRKFYETWTANPGMPKAEALRQAQVALLHGDVKPEGAPAAGAAAAPDSFTHPYYWAPFILIGNWR